MAKKSKEKAVEEQTSARKSGVLTNPIRNMIITAAVSVALGVAFLGMPVFVYSYCGYIIGGLLALIGICYIVIYFVRKPVSGAYRSEFAIGMIALLAGAYVAFSSHIPETMGAMTTTFTLAALVRLIGIAITVDGILKLQYAIDLGRMKCRSWWVTFLFSIAGITLGVLVTLGTIYSMHGFLGLSGMTYLGISFCLNGLLDICTMIVVAARNHKANKEAAAAMPSPAPAAVAAPAYVPTTPAPAPAPAPTAASTETAPAPTAEAVSDSTKPA